GGNLTMLRPGAVPSRPGGTAPPAAAPVSARGRPGRRWLLPTVVGAAVLLLLCGTGGVLRDGRLFRAPSTPPPVGPIAQTTANLSPSSAAPFARGSSAPTTTVSAVPATSTRAGGGGGGGGSTTPAGPRVEEFKVVSQPSCTTNAPGGTFEVPVVLQWKVSGGATGSELDVDGPGLYNTYGVQATDTLNFPCAGPIGTKNTHTYTVKTIGGGPTAAKTLTVTATVTQ